MTQYRQVKLTILSSELFRPRAKDNSWQLKTVRNTFLHEKHQLDSRFGPEQLAEGVDKQVEGQQAELNQ